MLPAIAPGAKIVALRQGALGLRLARVGEVVVFSSPIDPETWLIKRVAGIGGGTVEADGRTWPVGPDEMFVLSDNLSATRADSRTFGPVSVLGSYRELITFAPRLPD